MATQNAILQTNDRGGKRLDRLIFTGGTPATLNGATEFGFVLPTSPVNEGVSHSWKLAKVIISVGVNTTHSDGAITLSVEKNTDGGTSALTTTPTILDDAGTGFRSTRSPGTGITQAVPAAGADGKFAPGDVAFVTLSESGAGGTDPSDVFFILEFTRQSDFDATA